MSQIDLLPKEKRVAVFSDDRVYRYLLTIVWDDTLARMQVIGLNPSTADEVKDDPTIRRCKGFARDLGYGGLMMTNLFAFRSTDPEAMKIFPHPIGEEQHCVTEAGTEFYNRNDYYLWHARVRSKLAIAAWGVHGTHLNRAVEVAKWLPNLSCLGHTKYGNPRHPLYLKKTCQPQPL